MAAKGRSGKGAEAAAWAQQGEQYIQRLIGDEDLRASLQSAYGATRSALERVGEGKSTGTALLEDAKLHAEIRQAALALRGATEALREAPAKAAKPAKARRSRRRGGLRRTLLLMVVGGGLALALNEGLRTKVLDLMFGAEEEFDYTSTTTPEMPAPAGVAAG